jgi:hypothetical protein
MFLAHSWYPAPNGGYIRIASIRGILTATGREHIIFEVVPCDILGFLEGDHFLSACRNLPLRSENWGESSIGGGEEPSGD